MLTRCSKSLTKSLEKHAEEHYPSASIGVYPIENDSAVALVLVANKYSPNNFWYFTPLPTNLNHTAPHRTLTPLPNLDSASDA